MREIEFRGKISYSEHWAYGDLIHCDMLSKAGIIKAPYIYDCYQEKWQIDTETVGQYTGLKDKNGTKIFEGDIVLFEGWDKRIVIFGRIGYDSGKGATGFVFEQISHSSYDKKEGFYECDRNIDDDEIEVIGNKWDNPELLEDKL